MAILNEILNYEKANVMKDTVEENNFFAPKLK